MAGGPRNGTHRDMRLLPVIIAGGKGARLWPLSHDDEPKPLLRMAGGQSLLQLTLARLRALGETARPLIVCNVRHEQAMREHARTAGFSDVAMLLEPEGRNTAAAICAAAVWAEKRGLADMPLLIMPADHVIADEDRFASAVRSAIGLAASSIVTFAMKPDRPATGYGYIEPGEAIHAGQAQFRVRRFVEKPDAAKAAEFLASGGYYWNSGMFVATATKLMAEFRYHRPDILAGVEDAFPQGATDDRVRLDGQAFGKIPALAFDRAIMEQTASAATVLAEMGWNDVGDWRSVWEVSAKDGLGNAVSGPVTAVDTSGSLLRSEGPELLCIGLRDVVAIASRNAVLITRRDCTQKLGEIIGETRIGTDPLLKTTFISREYDLGMGEVRTIDVQEPGLRVFVCVRGRGRIATAAQEHAIEAGVTITTRTGESCRIEANADSFLTLVEIGIDGR